MTEIINILVAATLPDGGEKRIKDVSEQIRLTLASTDKPGELAPTTWADVDILYTTNLLPNPDEAPNLKWVQVNRAGVDSQLDHPLFRSQEVRITTMSGVITSQIAEYVLMTLLALGKKLPQLLQQQYKHHWPANKDKWEELLPVELRHSTVGILGYGSIGRQVARLLKPFGGTILAVKRDVMHPEDREYTREGMGDPRGDFFDRLYPFEALHSFLASCDFVVVALPLTHETQHILNAEAFEAMKLSAYLVNVGRGGLVDENALIQAIKTKQIAGAALDVFAQEPLSEDNPLWDLENVLITPHISGLSQHLPQETLDFFIENLKRYLEDKPLYNLVDFKLGY